MRSISVFAIIVALVGGLAASCGDDGQPSPTPPVPTTLSLIKTTVEMGEGQFRFTLELANAGDNAAVNVTAADVWQEGLEVTDVVHSVADQPPEDVEPLPDLRVVPVAIGDFGLQFTLAELETGEAVQLEYTARCQHSGEWQNTAAAVAINSDPVEAVVTVDCP